MPWKENRAEYERKAHAAIKSKAFKYKDLLTKGLQDARESFGVKNRKSNISVDKMRQTRAAAAAAGVDLKKRCGRCRSCMNAYAVRMSSDCLIAFYHISHLSENSNMFSCIVILLCFCWP